MLKLVSIDGNDTDIISLSDVKDHCYVTSSDDDTLLTRLLGAARRTAEKITWRGIVKATYTQYLDTFPYGEQIIELQKPPVPDVTSIKYYDPNGTLQTLSTDDYDVDLKSEPARIFIDTDWPDVDDDRLNAVEIHFTAGYDASLNDDFYKVPEDITTGMLLLIKHWYNNREAVVVSEGRNIDVKQVPLTARTLLEGESVKEFV